MTVIVAGLWAIDHPGLFARHRVTVLTLDQAWTDEAGLTTYLGQLLQARIHRLIVRRVDLVEATTVAEVRYELVPCGTVRSPDLSPSSREVTDDRAGVRRSHRVAPVHLPSGAVGPGRAPHASRPEVHRAAACTGRSDRRSRVRCAGAGDRRQPELRLRVGVLRHTRSGQLPHRRASSATSLQGADPRVPGYGPVCPRGQDARWSGADRQDPARQVHRPPCLTRCAGPRAGGRRPDESGPPGCRSCRRSRPAIAGPRCSWGRRMPGSRSTGT